MDFINDMRCNGFVVNREYPFLQDLKKCSYELGKHGININQIAKKVTNSKGRSRTKIEGDINLRSLPYDKLKNLVYLILEYPDRVGNH